MSLENKHLLTLAIPTYNRATKLNKQVAWAVDAIGKKWDQVELLISDNFSSDNTSSICEYWKNKLGEKISIFRNQKNIGISGNYLRCIQEAKGKYLWVVSDDDILSYKSVDIIVAILTTKEIDILHLNHKCTDEVYNTTVTENFYDINEDILSINGKEVFQELVSSKGFGGFMFITANIIKTETLKLAYRHLPLAKKNLAFSLFAAGYASKEGVIYVSSYIHCNCMYGRSSWLKDLIWLSVVDVPDVFYYLRKLGYNYSITKKQVQYIMSWTTLRELFFYARKNRPIIIYRAFLNMFRFNVFLKFYK